MNPEKPPDRSTPRTRELGAGLRSLRAQAGKSGPRLAHELQWPHTKVCRADTGQKAIGPFDIGGYVMACAEGPINRPYRDYLVGLAQEKDHPSGHWLRAGGPDYEGLPLALRSLIEAERLAHTIENFNPDLVPGLLQTEPYMRAIFHAGSSLTADEIERRIRVRLQRQALLSQQNPPHSTFFLHERVLSTMLGDAKVMRNQIQHLVQAMTPHCIIRVIPEQAGPYAALSGAFILFGHRRYDPTVYTDTWTAAVFVEKADEVALYQGFLTQLDSVALTAGQSREWLADLASHYDRMEARTSCAPPSPPP